MPKMTKLKPKLEDLNDKLDELADMSDMRAAKEGGETIAKIFKIRTDAELSLEQKREQINDLHEEHKVSLAKKLGQTYVPES